MQYTGASLLMELLKRQGIGIVAGIPGGANLPVYDALGQSDLRHILVRHERAGGFLAQGMARSTGRAAACFATSGPGAVNLLTAVADAKLDSVPIVAVTGQVASRLIGTDAFQEVDTYGMSIPVTKHNFLVRSVAELLEAVPEAFRLALSGRQGPVLIDMPKDVQQARIDLDAFPYRASLTRRWNRTGQCWPPWRGSSLLPSGRSCTSAEGSSLPERRRKCVRCPRRAGSRSSARSWGWESWTPATRCTLGCWACTAAA